nr:hypothetical protein [Deltaproteobacteria bacterium]
GGGGGGGGDDEPSAMDAGGCSAGGSTTRWFPLALFAGLALRRRRQRVAMIQT